MARSRRRIGRSRNGSLPPAAPNSGKSARCDIPVIAEALASHDEPLVRGHAAWALGRLAEHDPTTARRSLDTARRAEPDAEVRAEIDAALEEMA